MNNNSIISQQPYLKPLSQGLKTVGAMQLLFVAVAIEDPVVLVEWGLGSTPYLKGSETEGTK